ncbi:MAG: YabP/YqfC family sporulation protein [Clostridia bacterium]|nr:YabP/YqfC family sporulation protein [Clostridia bacterium]
MRKINKLLEIPEEIYMNTPKITLIGFNKIVIENYKNILEYQDIFIRVNTSIGIINISGLDLKMEEMTIDDIAIIGRIDSIDFEEIEE